MEVLKEKSLLNNIGVQVVIAMIVGTAVGAMMGHDATVFAPLGAIFINLIKMLVIPLVAVALISGAAGLGNSQSAGKVGIVTLGYFGLTSALAVALALFMGEVFQPGMGIDVSGVEGMFSAEYASKGELPTFWATITGMIPTNVFQSLNEANILQILVFCMFFGIAISKQAKERREPIINGVNCIVDAMVWMINKVMIIAPIGVFGLMAEAVGTFGFGALMVVFKLFVVYVAAILIFGFVVYPAMVHVLTKTSAKKFLSSMKKPQAVALSTASSMATLPVTMDTCEKELGVKNSTASFVLPLGATINMSGNAIYYGLVAIFFAQLFNIDLGMGAYIAIIVTSTLGAVGQAGVPGPSFLVVAVLLAAGIPIEGLPLLFALDRIFDMIRTALNITGDAACAVIVDALIEEETAEAELKKQEA
ncbi:MULTISPECIES: dicarboxylate/amino acid:cation symporter [Vibrio]|uniref:dicarboxylate/amino acid:cation symporter n=1 Tax=Vibrio TaxID=662 RepID=UPI00148387D4|nr:MULTISPECIES: dicarboxylate/amino acid:cation symporter [Vibrio]EJA7358434.1 dicarboxylate/amino acid:cation symporter [Vibrio alginolyticus]ELB2804601.1 dicarboxylate/amino acid:cation symporter [Vibrio alginolyticus]ELB2843101.1 dicarboxylate/amino acid:cation symporter [Vibrio alginolyticus]ELB2863628.1 dicarboxylate/amino acid:cation symporter [Vibrio alginolyticus]ELU8566757.1 dicarboxylate/amino acid:cation symporter [Vibrio alginolyticus]